ncbi:MAG: TCP-1/cpn60 chaperonin family protein [Planctomycetota bacterium]|nr:TCP-1/cpn60 chaperonin family protein [Planctomycetota bacterium]
MQVVWRLSDLNAILLAFGIRAIEDLELEGDEKVGAMIVRRAIESSMRQIATNAGRDGAVVVQNVRGNKNWGYNAATETYEDLVKSGVIDPTKVVRTALQNAASVANLLLTTDTLVSDLPEKEKESRAEGTATDTDRSRIESRAVRSHSERLALFCANAITYRRHARQRLASAFCSCPVSIRRE